MRWIVLVLLMLCGPALAGQAEARFEQAADLTVEFASCGNRFAFKAGLAKERAVFAAVEGKLKRRCLPYLEKARALLAEAGNAQAKATSASAVYRSVRGVFMASFERGVRKQREVLAAVDRSDIHGLPMHRLTQCSLDFANDYAGSKLGSPALFAAISHHCRAQEDAFRRTFAADTPEDRFQTAFRAVYAGPVGDVLLSGTDR